MSLKLPLAASCHISWTSFTCKTYIIVLVLLASFCGKIQGKRTFKILKYLQEQVINVQLYHHALKKIVLTISGYSFLSANKFPYFPFRIQS